MHGFGNLVQDGLCKDIGCNGCRLLPINLNKNRIGIKLLQEQYFAVFNLWYLHAQSYSYECYLFIYVFWTEKLLMSSFIYKLELLNKMLFNGQNQFLWCLFNTFIEIVYCHPHLIQKYFYYENCFSRRSQNGYRKQTSAYH